MDLSLQNLTMYLLQGSDFGTTLLYKQGDIFTENILFYIYFTLLKITISTGMNSFLLIQRGAGPQCRRVAQAKDKAGIVCGSEGGASACSTSWETGCAGWEPRLRSRLSWTEFWFAR